MTTTPTESWEHLNMCSWIAKQPNHGDQIVVGIEEAKSIIRSTRQQAKVEGYVEGAQSSVKQAYEKWRLVGSAKSPYAQTRREAYTDGWKAKELSLEVEGKTYEHGRREAFLEAAEVAEKDCQCGGYRDTTTTRRHTPECRSEDIAQALEDKALAVTKLQRKSKEILG